MMAKRVASLQSFCGKRLRYLNVFIAFFSSIIFCQAQKQEDYSVKVFQSEFNQEDNLYWANKEQPDFKHFIKDGFYIFQSETGGKRFYSGLKYNKIPSKYLLSIDFRFLKDKSLWGSFGVVIGAKNKLQDALLIQLDKKSRFRLAQLQGAETIKIVSQSKVASDYGWITIKAKPINEWQNLKVQIADKQLIILVDNQAIYTYSLNNQQQTEGNIGFYGEGPLSVEIDKLSLFATKDTKITEQVHNPDKQMDMITLDELSKQSGDIAKLASALSDYKKENAELQEKIDDLQIENKLLRNKHTELQDELKRVQKEPTQDEISKLKAENKKLSKENEALRNEVVELNQYKDIIKKNKDADLVIVLTENLKKEQKITAQLKEQIKKLESKKTKK